jgi:carboxymethylenebutenolidase
MKRYDSLGLAALLCLNATSAFAHATPMTLHTANAESFTAYVDGPKQARRGVVLVHDWFGVSPFYTRAVEKLAHDGYRVVAVDLYGGRHATSHEEAGKLLAEIDDDVAAREIDAAVGSLAKDGRKVAVMGFSMGAKHALAAALRDTSVAATVLWYGETSKDAEKLRHLSGPALLIVGSHDGKSATEDAAAFGRAADAAGIGAEVFVYPGADHAFAQPLFNQGRTYDAAGTEVAWLLSEDFLARRLQAVNPKATRSVLSPRQP